MKKFNLECKDFEEIANNFIQTMYSTRIRYIKSGVLERTANVETLATFNAILYAIYGENTEKVIGELLRAEQRRNKLLKKKGGMVKYLPYVG